MFGWFRDARICASRLNRASRFGVERDARRKNFQRDIALEPGIPRPVDLSHAAGANQGRDFVCAERPSEWKSHVR